MIKILFVCHGNICRSPMAEFIMKKLIADAYLSDKFFIASCATSEEEIWNGIGNPIYSPAQKELLKHKIPFDSGKRAIKLKASDYDEFDYLIAMDSLNVRNIMRIIGDDNDRKVYKLMDFTLQKGDVADPWYSGCFDVAFNDIYKGCCGLLKQIQKNF